MPDEVAERDAGEVDALHVTRDYPVAGGEAVKALADVTLHVSADESVAITGPSGSGKSTLLHILGAMDTPDSGTVTVGGEEVTAMTKRQLVRYRRTIGFVFQRFLLLPALPALDNVIAPLLPYRVDFDKRARGRELLEKVGVADRATHLPGQLSGGEQQRVAIARALINSPRLLLADEPTGNLDSNNGSAVTELLLQLADDGITVIIATHDPNIAERATTQYSLHDGCLLPSAAR
ncbi:MAG TPA: ABC transporter ATP-binding protein [Nocardioidaceae bacterium]|nr:ABC transporter ATP-binding protein [Nocardioidaceae bacterium]